MDDIKLLPCPFCDTTIPAHLPCVHSKYGVSVKCRNCGTTGPVCSGDNKGTATKYARKSWNTRPSLNQAAPDLLEACTILSRLTSAINSAQHANVSIGDELWSDLHSATIRAKAAITKAGG